MVRDEVLAVVLTELINTEDQNSDPSAADYAADIIRKLGRDYLPGQTMTFEGENK